MNRWFVTVTDNSNEDVGAYSLTHDQGALVFRDEKRIVTWIYAPGTWKFVEYQGEE